MNKCSSLIATIDGPIGFSVDYGFDSDELELVRSLIHDQWLSRIEEVAPERVKEFEKLGLERYHELADLLPHSKMWNKLARILPAYAVPKLRATSLFQAIQSQIGPFEISDEDHVGHEEIYWRIVRPDAAGDIGPLHADRWFFESGEKTFDQSKRLIKVWVAIYTQPGFSGLRVVPGSHLREWPHHGERRDGYIKPVFDVPEEELDIQILHMQPGQAVVFHDLLIHGGIPTRGDKTRVSIEFAILSPK